LRSDLEGQTAEMERLRSQATASSGHDDLKQIFGIGPVLEKRLNELGIHFFRQIAQWTTEDIQRLEQQLPKFQKRVERDRWVERAKERHFEKYGELP
jgi:large subunit ribosomal protein L21